MSDTTIVILVFGAVAAGGLIDQWRRDRGLFWACVGFATGMSWCFSTGAQLSFTTWQPDLGSVSHGVGYLFGIGVAGWGVVGGVFHK